MNGTTRTGRSGLSLIEVVIATFLVGVVLVGAMQVLGASVRSQREFSQRTKAIRLAEDLLGEILQQRYREPDSSPQFGVESGEGDGTGGPRTTWDDVDDYRRWSESPLQEKDGTVIPDTSHWRRWVEVAHVAPNNLSQTLADGNDRGVKRITVHVARDGITLATLAALQTSAWIDTIPDPGNEQTTGSRPPVNQPPTAVATATPISGTSPLTVRFDARGSGDPEGDPLTYAWQFGDGQNGTGLLPAHTFTATPGATRVCTVTLTVTDIHGAQDTASINITIYGN